jgi:menaquinol-cytochrome c reductase iron-sulfur subunit
MRRRTFFGLLVTGATMVVAGVVGIPALIAGLSPALQRRRREKWRPVGRLDDFPVGAVREGEVRSAAGAWPRSFRREAVFVWRRSETDVVVYSRSCTDLGCSLDYDAGAACFFCPCHGGIFTQEGARLAGPPPTPMLRYTHRNRDGMLEIDVSSIPLGA